MLFPIERSGFCRIEAASHCILRVIEPKANVESMRGQQARSWIEAKDLIQQNGFDRHFRISVAISLDVRLIPCQSEVLELGIYFSVGKQVCVLDGEQVKSEVLVSGDGHAG